MPTAPTLQRAANGARILETVANYGRTEVEESPRQRAADRPPATWFRGAAAVHEAQNLMAAVPPAKTAALIDAIRSLQPDLIPM